MLGKLLKRELKSYRLQVGITFLVAAIITVFMKVISMAYMADEVIPYAAQYVAVSAFLTLLNLIAFPPATCS